MEHKELKYVKGKIEAGKPATICFFDDVDYWSVSDFVWELNYIKDYWEGKPSEIKILINSVGGSCLDGIAAFSAIMNCDVPTTCIIEGIAASMASIIWAAGKKCQMRDYALLMIHNPWSETQASDPESQRFVDNFKTQLKTIYTKRFCMDEEQITAIMNGEDGYDGTFFTAQQAVEAGFLSAEDVIETPSIKNTIAAKIEGIKDCGAIASVMQGIINKNLEKTTTKAIINKSDNSLNTKENKMNEQINVFAALLGMTGDKVTEANVTAEIQNLIKVQDELKTTKSAFDALKEEHNAMKLELEGSKASVENLTKNLDETKAALKVFQDAEAQKKAEEIDNMVEAAIKACKINKDAKASWVSMAEQNYDLAKQTLDSIPAREDIQAGIANNPENKKNAEDGMTDAEREAKAMVDEIVGKDFKFHTTEELA